MESGYQYDARVKFLERGIDKREILKYVQEEEIFELAFNYKPQPGVKVISPFRKDKNPGCWFEQYRGRLRFVDFGNSQTGSGASIDCFDAVKFKFDFDNFRETLLFLYSYFMADKDGSLIPLPPSSSLSETQFAPKPKVYIHTRTREYEARDKRYWSKYGISRKNLLDDKVFPVKEAHMINAKRGTWIYKPWQICYSFSDFPEDRKKIYNPLSKGRGRFFATCKAEDVGEIKSLPSFGEQLVISKSYKDCRVLRNLGINAVWFQNEGMFPSKETLKNLCVRFEQIVVFFDNDDAGLFAAEKLKELLNGCVSNKARAFHIPIGMEKDPADLRRYRGNDFLKNLLHENLIKF